MSRFHWILGVKPQISLRPLVLSMSNRMCQHDVIINERTGTIVATQNVRISPVAVSSSNITIFLNPTTESVNHYLFLKERLPFYPAKMLNSLKKSDALKPWRNWILPGHPP